MKFYLLLLTIVLLSGEAFGDEDPYIISQQRSIRIVPVYQSWKSDTIQNPSEISTPVEIIFPFSRKVSLSIYGNQATAQADHSTKLSGMSDTQVAFSYYIQNANLVFSLSLNLPSGKNELTLDEFYTSILFSRNFLNFELPQFGQGLNIAPGLTWALPLSDNWVAGLGASYQIRGSYKPLSAMVGEYKPGNEVLLTGGFDFRAGETASASLDWTWTSYSADKIGAIEVFKPGQKVMTGFQFRKYFGYDILWLFIRYRSTAKNQVVIGGNLSAETAKTHPDQVEWRLLYRKKLNEQWNLGMSVEGRHFQKTPALDGLNLFGLGITPEISLSKSVQIPVRIKLWTGKFNNGNTISGSEIGAGLEYRF